MCKFILASGSSRRQTLLKQLNLEYRVSVPSIAETPRLSEMPEIYVYKITKNKALQVFDSLSGSKAVLAADTIISLSREIIGKPKGIQHAKKILKKLSAVEHDVLTALYLKTQNHEYEAMVKTKVKFRKLTSSEIYAYCLTGEPYDKAGAYAIQGLASSFVEYISGSYTNVIGLPLLELRQLLQQANLCNLDAQ